MRSEKEILDALHVIQEVCNGRCVSCPLRDVDNDCKLQVEEPREWEIKDPSLSPRLILN